MLKNVEINKAAVELGKMYSKVKKVINERINEFKQIGEEADGQRIFMELCFCLLTPASKASNAWKTVERLHQTGLLYKGNIGELANNLNMVRFKNNKAKNIVLARSIFYKDREFQFDYLFEKYKNDPFSMREWIVNNIRGMAYKESTHFLRNIGMSGDLCILDRHILKNLDYYGAINGIPSSLSKSRYLDIEKKMQEFSKLINIPVSHLDLLLWYKETGRVFK